MITVHISAAGGIVVTERLTWRPAMPAESLVLSLKRRITGPGVPTGQAALPRVTGLQAAYDGGVVTPSPVTTPRLMAWSILAPTSAPGRHVLEVQYREAGVAVPSTPGPPGRATVVVAPLLIAQAGHLPVWLEVIGPSAGAIHAVNCPLAAPAKVVCGDQRSGGWLVQPAPSDVADLRLVTVQADLPASG